MTGTKSTLKTTLDDRLGRFYVAWRGPAIRMLTRAFGSQLDEHTREDAYSSAWAASLSALGERVEGMSDAELRSYVFSAVTTHAGKELRRRGRRPVEPLNDLDPAGPPVDEPVESLERHEDRRVLRDVLASLPDRRRRVITLRYAVGLTPDEICEVIDGLSLRAYRKEITRGIKDLAVRMEQMERGEWCARLGREIRAFARGQASGTGQEQARAHLAHCAFCTRTVRELATSLHDLSLLPVSGLLAASAPTWTGPLEGSIGMLDRAKGVLGSVIPRAGDAEGVATSMAASGGTRGGGTALLTGIGAKVGALGLAGKAAVGCIGATAGLATCVATGVVPATAVDGLLPDPLKSKQAGKGSGEESGSAEPAPAAGVDGTIFDEGTTGERTAPVPKPDASDAPGVESANESTDPGPAIAPESVTPIERESAPEVAAATSEPDSAGGGTAGSPKKASSSQASAQLGTP